MAKTLTPIRIDQDILKDVEDQRTKENRTRSNMIETLLLEAITIRKQKNKKK